MVQSAVTFWPPTEGISTQREGYVFKKAQAHGVTVAELRRYKRETEWVAVDVREMLEQDEPQPTPFARGTLDEMKQACIERYGHLSLEEAESVWRS